MNNDEIERLQTELEVLSNELRIARLTIRRAKDAAPVERPSYKRVLEIVSDALMTVVRIPGGWQLKFGRLTKRFRRLKDIWEILTTDDWALGDIFTLIKLGVKLRSTSKSAPPPPLPKGGDVTFFLDPSLEFG